VFSEEAYLGIAKEYVPVVRRELDAETRSAIDDALAIVAEIAARAAPAPVAVAVLPSELQVNPALRASVLASLGLEEGDLDLDQPARATRAALEARGVAVIDLLPPLADAERGAPTYALRDSHWNERGNAIAAQALADALEAQTRRMAAAKSAQAGVHR
jgi:alginate O-acetyltransferase complex protein AlgJ